MAKTQAKRPMPKHVITRLAGLAQQRAAVDAAQNQLLQDFLGFLGIDPTRDGLWINDDEDPPTYEILTRQELERRVRLKQAAAQAPKEPG